MSNPIIKHQKNLTIPDGTDPDVVRPSDWNADHQIEQNPNRMLGRVSAGAGPTEELTPEQSRTVLGLGTAALVNVGTGANQIVQLDGSARLPAVDGSQLTGLTTTLGSLSDVDTTGATSGDGLVFDGAEWVPGGLNISAVDADIIPDSDGTRNLGSTTNAWDELHANDVRADNYANRVGDKSVPAETVVNGTAKARANINGVGTIALRASINISSLTSNATNDMTLNFTGAFADANFSASHMGSGPAASTTGSGWSASMRGDVGGPTSTSLRFIHGVQNLTMSTLGTPPQIHITIHGDLA